MNENDLIHRAIPVQVSDEHPEGLYRITVCDECPAIYRVADLGICECGLKELRIDFDEEHAIHPDCPLLTVAQVREYPASEKPGDGARVELIFTSGLKAVGVYDYQESAWYYNAGLGKHFAYIKLNSCGVANIKSWRNLP